MLVFVLLLICAVGGRHPLPTLRPLHPPSFAPTPASQLTPAAHPPPKPVPAPAIHLTASVCAHTPARGRPRAAWQRLCCRRRHDVQSPTGDTVGHEHGTAQSCKHRRPSCRCCSQKTAPGRPGPPRGIRRYASYFIRLATNNYNSLVARAGSCSQLGVSQSGKSRACIHHPPAGPRSAQGRSLPTGKA
ncbi:hypothetical protein IWZ01DRAFT_142444 [Phyllosticta capitalensis]